MWGGVGRGLSLPHSLLVSDEYQRIYKDTGPVWFDHSAATPFSLPPIQEINNIYYIHIKSNYKDELGLLHVYFFATTNLFRMASRADHTRQVDAQT